MGGEYAVGCLLLTRRGRGEQKREKVTACSMFLSLWEGKTRAVDAMEEYSGTWYAPIKITGKKPIIYYLKICTLLWITNLKIVTLDFVQVYILSQ